MKKRRRKPPKPGTVLAIAFGDERLAIAQVLGPPIDFLSALPMALSDLAVERIEEAKELSRAGIDLTCIAFEQYFTPDDWRSGYWDPVGEASVPALALATPPATTVGIRVYTSNLVPELLAANHRVGPWGIGADERLVDKMLSPSWRGNLTRQ